MVVGGLDDGDRIGHVDVVEFELVQVVLFGAKVGAYWRGEAGLVAGVMRHAAFRVADESNRVRRRRQHRRRGSGGCEGRRRCGLRAVGRGDRIREKIPISISAVARRAKVGRNSIHRRPELLALIKSHQPLSMVTDRPAPAPAPGSESSIIAALQIRLTAKDATIGQLKAQLRQRDDIIATLQGELERLNADT